MSEPTSNLATALARVQGELPRIVKNKTANMGTYTTKYADLASFADAVMPVLSRHGLAWMTRPTLTDSGFVLAYELVHGESGEIASGVYPLPDPTRGAVTAQAVGSAITYARRYALSCVVGAVADEDDDGHAASQAKPPAAKTPTKRAAPAAAAPAPAAPALPPRRTDQDWLDDWVVQVMGALYEEDLDRLLDELHAQYEARALTVADKDACKTLLAEKRGDLQKIAADWGGTPTQDGAE